MKLYDELKALVDGMAEDVQAFDEKGNNSAAGRIRKVCQDIRKNAAEMRKDIQEKRNAAREAKKGDAKPAKAKKATVKA